MGGSSLQPEQSKHPTTKDLLQSLQPMEITIGSTTYIVNSFFKEFGKTFSEKLYGIMEKDIENAATACYNNSTPKECLAVGNLGGLNNEPTDNERFYNKQF